MKEKNNILIIITALEVDKEKLVKAPYSIKMRLEAMRGKLKVTFNLLKKRKTAPPTKEMCKPEIESR